uniref:Heparan-alpha-glucosaminide N-acetyltransferase n=1 Tax=Cajanus cajan TaxID=3821 RepID=A0A151SFF2_CAJCA|nr:Heparan-alpha-glucosaminide N-acetyltransferase [Cajanus cajan]
MADSRPLLLNDSEPTQFQTTRVASLDVFRGLSVFLMIFVDYGGSILPFIAHVPWNGIHLADFVMPFFLFIAGISLALVYKRRPQKTQATWKALARAMKLFALGIVLQGGYFHGITSLTFGVDIETIRLMGILQRISIGYIVAALCEIWLPAPRLKELGFFKSYYWHWFLAVILLAVYSVLLYGLYVPDWHFDVSSSTSSLSPFSGGDFYTVNCSVRGDLGPACNSAGMIDRYILGLGHLYRKPVYRNLKECNMSSKGQVSDSSPSWCHAPFDPEGILSSITAAVSCIIGLQYGHVLAHLQDHKGRIDNWMCFSFSFLGLGSFLALIGIPLNKSLYTVSYMLLTSAVSGLTFIALYVLVDVHGYRRLTAGLEWMGKHALSIFVLVSSNLAVIAIQGFYWTQPENNIIHWIVTRFNHT